MKSETKQKGFTLVEVIIVVAIVGILSAVVTPVIMAMLPRYHLRAEARELLINFKKAKIDAIRRNRDVVIVFSGVGTANGSYQIYVNEDKIIPRAYNPPTDIQIINKQLQKSVCFVSSTFNPAGYNSKGLPLGAANQNVKLETTDSAREFTLTMSLAGNVRLQ